MGETDRQLLRASWLASLAYSVNMGPMRDLDSNKHLELDGLITKVAL